MLPSLDRALIEAAEEMDFDWPEFLAMKRIKVAMAGSAGRSLLGGWLGSLSGGRGFWTTSATTTKNDLLAWNGLHKTDRLGQKKRDTR
jgi:hypothetical protein